MIRRATILLALVACALSAGIAHADTTVTVDPAKITNGYMNVFELPANGGGYQFGSPWGFGDLVGVYSANDLTLSPNSIGDPNAYWYTPSGGPGSVGNKTMEANSYAEDNVGTYAGQTLTFRGTVSAFSLAPSHTVVAFIKDFAPDFSSFNVTSVPLTATGNFTISLATVNDAARHVQYGFQLVGPDVWITDVGPYGSVTIVPYDPAVSVQHTSWGSLKALYR